MFRGSAWFFETLLFAIWIWSWNISVVRTQTSAARRMCAMNIVLKSWRYCVANTWSIRAKYATGAAMLKGHDKRNRFDRHLTADLTLEIATSKFFAAVVLFLCFPSRISLYNTGVKCFTFISYFALPRLYHSSLSSLDRRCKNVLHDVHFRALVKYFWSVVNAWHFLRTHPSGWAISMSTFLLISSTELCALCYAHLNAIL